MQIDAWLRDVLEHVAEDARVSEEVGYDGAWNSEGKADAFLPIALAAEHSERLVLGSSVAVAFARSPMSVAYQAVDLQRKRLQQIRSRLRQGFSCGVQGLRSDPWSGAPMQSVGAGEVHVLTAPG